MSQDQSQDSAIVKLQLAIEQGDFWIVRKLVQNGDVFVHGSTVLPNGKYPAELARQLGHSEIVEWLISESAYSFTVKELQEEVRLGNLENVSQILKSGKIDVKQRIWPGDENDTPLKIAIRIGRVDMVELLVDSGFSPDGSCIALAASEQNLKIIELLIDAGGDVNGLNMSGQTPLFSAVATGNITIVKRLVEYGADVNFQDRDEQTPLDCAAFNGHQEVFKYLFPLTSSELRVFAQSILQFGSHSGESQVRSTSP